MFFLFEFVRKFLTLKKDRVQVQRQKKTVSGHFLKIGKNVGTIIDFILSTIARAPHSGKTLEHKG